MKKNQKSISDQEIQKALKKFKEKGGLIRKLPSEIVPRSALVGAKFGIYEGPQEGLDFAEL